MIEAASIERLRTQFLDELERARSERDVQTVRDHYLGRKQGALAALLKEIGRAPADQRPVLGRLANELKTDFEAHLAARHAAVHVSRPPAHAVDVTLEGRLPALGHRHPLTVLRDRMEEKIGRASCRERV